MAMTKAMKEKTLTTTLKSRKGGMIKTLAYISWFFGIFTCAATVSALGVSLKSIGIATAALIVFSIPKFLIDKPWRGGSEQEKKEGNGEAA